MGQAAEQIIAGVVLSERLAVTMYGAIHRAQWGGHRNLRGLVIDPKVLAEASFRNALTDATAISTAIGLDHPSIVPTVAVESDGRNIVIVTRGVGRYVTVQDLISAARVNRKEGGKLALPVAAAIGKSVVEALSAAHRAKVVHGAVHPRSVLIDEDGAVRLGDFVVGRALTTAVAQGADSSLWRGLTGYVAPELAVGEAPSPSCDVFAVGAMLFTMLSGEVPPGTLHVTPAVERLVQRALDTDPGRRYASAADLLENLLEAFEDDRWDLADRGEVIKAAGLSRTDTNIDEATEDLLASLGSLSAGGVQVMPISPSIDSRAESVAARHQRVPTTGANRLDALLADLDEGTSTSVEALPFKRDPISELISMDPRKREAIVQVKSRVPSLDDPDDLDDHTPLPAPQPDFDGELSSPTPVAGRSSSRDEFDAMDAIAGLSRSGTGPEPALAAPAPPVLAPPAPAPTAPAPPAPARPESARSVPDGAESPPAAKPPRPVARPIVDPIMDLDLPPPRLKSPLRGVIGLLILVALGGGAVFLIVKNQDEAAEKEKLDREHRAEKQREADELTKQLTAELADPGAISVTSTPPQAGVWLKLGRTPVDSLVLSSSVMHEVRIEGVEGYQAVDTQVQPGHWNGDKDKRAGKLVVTLKPIGKDPKTGKVAAVKLPAMPAKPPDAIGEFQPGRGPIHVESSPKGAEVWLYIGMTDQVRLEGIQAGRDYELRVLKDGFLPAYVSVTADEWRDPTGDKHASINAAKKKPLLEKSVALQADPSDHGSRPRN